MARLPLLALPAALLPALAVHAQDPIWTAHRATNDLVRLSACGSIEQVVPLGTSLRSANQAPDGKIWVIRFIQPQFDILDADGTNQQTISFAFGNPFAVTFDRSGHAWMSGGSGVEEFDASGNSLATYPLAAPNALGITIDADGNKWVAHREAAPPGSISRVDAITGLVTNHPLPANALILPTRVVADFRGVGTSSHIWVIGDNRGSGDLAEFDPLGNALNLYSPDPAGRFGSITADPTGRLWITDFGNGSIHDVDPSNGLILNTYSTSMTSLFGVEIGPFGALWATIGSTTDSKVLRINRFTGAIEVQTITGNHAQSAPSARSHYALVVDPTGDLDGDLVPNITEIMSVGSSPFDACSNTFTNLVVTGSTMIGGMGNIRLTTAAGSSSAIFVSTGFTPPGFVFPGIGCTFALDPVGFVPIVFNVTGSGSLPFTIPMDNLLAGLNLWFQPLTAALPSAQWGNGHCVQVYN